MSRAIVMNASPQFSFHSVESAPEGARPLLQGAKAKLGFVPSLYAGLAESPSALGAYFDLADRFAASSLSPTEQQVVALAVSVANGCRFCVAAHSTIARHMVKVDSATVDALRHRQPIADARLQALRRFAERVVRDAGRVLGPELDAFLAAGYSPRQALDVVLGVSMKTLSNYANHLMQTPVDAAFASERWEPLDAAA